MKPRFQADNDLRSAIRTGLLRREASIDFQSARQAGLDHLPDLEVLGLAALEGRILVSHDENSMPANFVEFTRDGHASPGVLLVPQWQNTRDAIENLLMIWIASDASEWADKMTWLPL